MERSPQFPSFIASPFSAIQPPCLRPSVCPHPARLATPPRPSSLRARPRCSSVPSSDDSSPVPVPSSPSGSVELKVGQIVAIQRQGSPTLSGGPELGLITGCSSSGETVDVQPLEAFVKELYVMSKKRGPTFEKASDIRVVNYEYAPSQDAWIVLDEDLINAQNLFRARAPPTDSNPKDEKVTVSVKKGDDASPLSEEAKQRQFFRPSKQQAFLAAGLSIPLAAVFWSAFATVRETFDKNPTGTDLLHGNFFRTLIQIVTAGSCVSSLIIGSAMFLYALSKSDDTSG